MEKPSSIEESSDDGKEKENGILKYAAMMVMGMRKRKGKIQIKMMILGVRRWRGMLWITRWR